MKSFLLVATLVCFQITPYQEKKITNKFVRRQLHLRRLQRNNQELTRNHLMITAGTKNYYCQYFFISSYSRSDEIETEIDTDDFWVKEENDTTRAKKATDFAR